MSAVSTASANKKFHIAKFGGTSVANFETMYKSADIVIANKNVRIVVLSASSSITNLLIKLTETCNDNRRKALLKQIRQHQYTIINCLDNPLSIQPIIARVSHRHIKF
ncbi:hypothetical protein CBG25_16980 [Arsenophonus sp. ENCA]|uniref:hypothetical protein n=1 Tax=Arsenophonus sp. ENCA TaxID=1987579 RepID=UPI000BDD17FD|nr:hypothetical protein [Arsenophonus sp. ENCA]PAV01386.1 hypothetical protein CBG25_16980 [Arsenophonus sp. ENCA]